MTQEIEGDAEATTVGHTETIDGLTEIEGNTETRGTERIESNKKKKKRR